MNGRLIHRNLVFLSALILLSVSFAATQSRQADPFEKVLTLTNVDGPKTLPQDRGAPGLWQKLQKLQTTGSALHIKAHPDDEHGGMITYLSRGLGVRMAMLTLNRGESGANAIGPELFDGLGLIRTEELLVADRYYGMDDQYFTTVIDYGFSKNLSEALDKWGKDNVLRDAVRVVRINRPFVIIARFNGTERDGHGNHQTAGIIAQEVFKAAGDPNMFPEQISKEGLRPWQPLKMYRGGIRPNERWNVMVNDGQYSPWLGQSYRQFAALGLSFQRSQNSGRMREYFGASSQPYERVYSIAKSPEKESGFFDGIDTSLSGIFNVVSGTPEPEVIELLGRIEREAQNAVDTFNVRDPSACVPALARGLKATREALVRLQNESDAAFLLRIKERQFMVAIHCALGLNFSAVGFSAAIEPDDSPFAPSPTMGVVVPGQEFKVETILANGGNLPVTPLEISLAAPDGWTIRDADNQPLSPLQQDGKMNRYFRVTVSPNAEPSRRYFYRDSIQESRYKMRDGAYLHLPSRKPVLIARARYTVEGVPLEIREIVRTREANLPYGYDWHELKVAPAVAVNVKPDMRVVPLNSKDRRIRVQVELINNQEGGLSGQLTLNLPAGWKSQPAVESFNFSQAGERRNFSFMISMPALENRDYTIYAVATAGSKQYKEGYQIISHRDLETNYLYRDADITVRGVNVSMAPNIKVGYVMGVGDEVPSGIEQLGAKVQLLGEDDLAGGNLQQYDAIVVGTRAYAVRNDLITYNQRLLDYARQGGNLIILYQTQEFIPGKWAAFPAALPPRAEEVSEEDSPVKILAPDHPVFNRPNKITLADFDHWVEQRGSKFFSEWDKAYIPMIETQDRNQAPQRGGWLTAKYGSGYYTYWAYAIHRQVPYGVAGAYRLLANVLISLGK